jgi:hypothetical protein
MSASLPRIKTVHEMSKLNISEMQKDVRVKFRRLTLEDHENV